ncbi:hypothetical protein LZ554_003549 [Drepanopeziza brunnea f. sp. 'monogermtubi']|nr:hypothetical protein LZ554_003549 [Drepanopeziza brunnea f. sp. 'monogermtubi']
MDLTTILQPREMSRFMKNKMGLKRLLSAPAGQPKSCDDTSAQGAISTSELVPLPSDADADSATATSATSANSTPALNNASTESTISPSVGHEFTLFPKLPGELRAKIWRLGIRVGHFSIQHASYKITDESWAFWKSEETDSMPITLRINRESRAETLRNCFLLPRTGSRPIYANPAAEVCWLEFVTLIYSKRELSDWLSSLHVLGPMKFLSAITRLEVRDFFFAPFFKKMVAENYIKSRDRRALYFAAFLHFPRLKQICFTCCISTLWASDANKAEREWAHAWIGALLEENKDCFEGGEVPQLVFRAYKTVEEIMLEG